MTRASADVLRTDEIAAAARVLACGGVVAYPTETVYGLGVDARNAAAIAQLIELKGRDAGLGLSLLVSGMDMAVSLLAERPPPQALLLAERFWPGPLTIVLPAAASLASELRGPSGGVGLRCSSDPWASALVARFAAPLTSTSANRSGAEAARSAGEVRAAFAGAAERSPFVLDGGSRRGSQVSTVIEFCEGTAMVLRAGAIGESAIASIIPLAERAHG